MLEGHNRARGALRIINNITANSFRGPGANKSIIKEQSFHSA